MLRISPLVLGSLLALSLGCVAQDDGNVALERTTIRKPVRKQGTIYKDAVDGLIHALRDTARQDQAGAAEPGVLGSDVASTAKILVAMGHCHRRYHISDGPVVRPSVAYLLKNRKSEGNFGDAITTAWVVEALEIMNADSYRAEVEGARRWLQRNGAAAGDEAAESVAATGFERLVADVLAEVRADRYPQQMAEKAADLANAWFAEPQTLQRSPAADSLLALVACQVANHRLDDVQGQGPQAQPWSAAQEKAFAWLYTQQQDGIFSVAMPVPNDKGEQVMRSFPDPALTGFGLMAMQTKPKAKRTAEQQAAIDTGLAWLVTQQNEDGTFGERVPNYTTCVVVGALSRAENPAFAPVLQKAQKAILMFQNAESGGYQRSDRDYGSIGYGNSQRGDLSNLHFSIEALRATGLPENHEALQKALVFLQRTQNLKSVNDFKGKLPDPEREGVILDATSGDDGGAVYYPGNSAAGYVVQPDGKSVPRSYGSMTYALLKSYTLAGLEGDDPRVQAAVQWIQNNWTLAVNPGADPALGEKVKYQGLFYYYMVLAQALDTADIDGLTKVTEGTAPTQKTVIDWRVELRKHLEAMQQDDGTWVNGKNGRWMESLPLLCTCYAMVALERCR